MNRTIATLLTDATDIHIRKQDENSKADNNEQTVIEFKSATWPDKDCIHILSGKWEIERINKNVVHLINHDKTIRDNGKN